jgi:peroxiredoxin
MARKNRTGRITSLAAAITLAAGAALTIGVTGVSASPEQAPHSASAEHAIVGQVAPDFTLTDINGVQYTLSAVLAEDGVSAVVLEWFNPDCPFVKKHHEHNNTMTSLASEFAPKGVRWFAINSGAEGKQGAGIDRNKTAAAEYAMEYPILLDPYGEVGQTYEARTTPHMYVIDSKGTLVYAGGIDNDASARKLGDVNYVKAALNSVLANKPVETSSSKPYGCNVKY